MMVWIRGRRGQGRRSTLFVVEKLEIRRGGAVRCEKLLRRWGRRSELQFYGSKRHERNFWEDLDGVHYDNQFIFDELGWNFTQIFDTTY